MHGLFLRSCMIWSWLPSRVLWVLGNALGGLFSLFPSPARRVAARNLELCFPGIECRKNAVGCSGDISVSAASRS